MAVIVLTNAEIGVNSVVLSDKANSVELNYEVDSVEVTTFGNVGHQFTGGLQNVTCAIEFLQDFAATETEATLYPLVGTTTTVTIKPNAAAPASATNPVYTLSGTFLASHQPVSAAVGELAMTSVTFTGGELVKTTA